MASKSLPPITVGKDEYAERIAHVIADAFAGDALNRAAVLSLDSLPNDAEIPRERRIKHFLPSIKTRVGLGAHLVEAGDWAAVALWVPPDVKLPPPDLSTLPAPLVEYKQKYTAAKKRHLGDRSHWYLNLLGRHPERQEPGAIRALFDPCLLQARKAGLPAWVEATNAHARDVYVHFGFKVVEVVVIGKGSIDANGNFVSGGRGVTTYGMLAEP
ncbi:uncharacterized protein PAC_17779 [Phialocephala subalpina]|uniref:N-acetyltransferase domain-containing protein n=1 Tax=Phialocephala subalpina TaxID=576137 RepID=A0A1L7XS76_9HELO|nr:uncharacterized protein PAC_17779 [Phialocephala subalpina]